MTAPGLFPLLALLTVLAGCAAPAKIDVPAELPLRTNEHIFRIEWALQREATVARAVGFVRPSFDTEFRMTLALFGTDAEGRIQSRDVAYLQSDFSRQGIPFAVEVTPTGRETGFVLRVLDYNVPTFRTN
jgi:hypothetical protein